MENNGSPRTREQAAWLRSCTVADKEWAMSESVLDMSMSLDGYVAIRRLSSVATMASGCTSGLTRPADRSAVRAGPAVPGEWKAAGAVLAGRRTAELMDHWGGDHDGLPIFVPSHRPPSPAARWVIRW